MGSPGTDRHAPPGQLPDAPVWNGAQRFRICRRHRCRALSGPDTMPGLCLRRFRPPRYAQVLVVNQQPVRVSSPTVNGRVVVAKGPWRTSGDWWQASAWNREEWDVALESGALYRLFREIDSGRWFVEGSYD